LVSFGAADDLEAQQEGFLEEEETPPLGVPAIPTPPGEGLMLTKLETLLSGKTEADARQAEEERTRKETAKFVRLEAFLISQQQTKVENQAAAKKA
jgi:hypothetical protein